MIMGHVKNWAKFQHYKDRSPPWIKLQKDLLNDWEFARLPIASKALAPLLWLLASETTDGSVSVDVGFLAFRLRWPEKDVSDGLNPLIQSGFVIVDSAVLAECYQDATPEGEGETEGETEKACASSSDEAPPRSDPIPYQAIADLFNSNMVGLAKVREVTTDRKTMIRTAWRSSKERQSIEFWQAYFEECAADPFLNGTGPYKPPHENWRPTFNHLLKTKVVTQVFEKALDRMEREA
jgi:hypothetical protein